MPYFLASSVYIIKYYVMAGLEMFRGTAFIIREAVLYPGPLMMRQKSQPIKTLVSSVAVP
ncbi:hypothetical protein DSUL_20436 [Desulfovibrionales bacterium]